MRGSPQAITSRLPRARPRRRWPSWIAGVIHEQRRLGQERHEVIERLAREERRARALGDYLPERSHRVRPW
jgi:hypothetical protein